MIVGSWVDGLVVVGQRPGRLGRIKGMPALAGKRAVVYLTYAIDAGKALQKMSDAVAARGAEVLGGQIIRRDKLDEGVADFVDRVLQVTSTAVSAAHSCHGPTPVSLSTVMRTTDPGGGSSIGGNFTSGPR